MQQVLDTQQNAAFREAEEILSAMLEADPTSEQSVEIRSCIAFTRSLMSATSANNATLADWSLRMMDVLGEAT